MKNQDERFKEYVIKKAKKPCEQWSAKHTALFHFENQNGARIRFYNMLFTLNHYRELKLIPIEWIVDYKSTIKVFNSELNFYTNDNRKVKHSDIKEVGIIANQFNRLTDRGYERLALKFMGEGIFVSDLMRSLDMLELNVYVVLINCCISACGGSSLGVLNRTPEPIIHVEDLIQRGWTELDAANLVISLESKKLVKFGALNEDGSRYDGMYLTDQWRHMEHVWQYVHEWDRKIENPEYRQTLIF